MVDFVEICRQETDIAFPPLEPELTQSFDHNEDIRSIYGMFLQPLVPNTILLQWNLNLRKPDLRKNLDLRKPDLRKPDLRKNLDLRKIVATTDFLVN